MFVCLPTGRENQLSATTGTEMRADQLETYAKRSPYDKVEILPIDIDLWRFDWLTLA